MTADQMAAQLSPPDASPANILPFCLDWSVDTGDCSFLQDGWATPEPGFVWMIGPESTLTLPAVKTNHDLSLHLLVSRPGGSTTVTVQVLAVSINGHCIGRYLIGGQTAVSCTICSDLFNPELPLEITFDHPCFVSMRELKAGSDERPLAISLFKLYLEPLRSTSPVALPSWVSAATATAVDVRWDDEKPATGSTAGRYVFGPSSSSTDLLQDGWTIDDEGWPLTSGHVSDIELPALPVAQDMLLRLGLSPVLVHLLVPRQRLTVVVNGSVVGQFSVTANTEIIMPLPGELIANKSLVKISLVTCDSLAMADFANNTPERLAFTLNWVCIDIAPPHLTAWTRRRSDQGATALPLASSSRFLDLPLEELSGAIHQQLGLSVLDILRDYESLGNNCAFGLAQRKAGVEVLGLLRFANTPFTSLMRGMADNFAAARDPDSITIELAEKGDPKEFLARICRYGVRWHTMVLEDAGTAEQVKTEQVSKLLYLQRRLLSGLAASRKIYVFGNFEPRKIPIAAPAFASALVYEEDPEPIALAEAAALLLEINKHGRNTLLYVVPCRDGHPSGSAELLMPGLIIGYLATFVISADTSVHDHADWLRLGANAWALDQGPNHLFRAGHVV